MTPGLCRLALPLVTPGRLAAERRWRTLSHRHQFRTTINATTTGEENDDAHNNINDNNRDEIKTIDSEQLRLLMRQIPHPAAVLTTLHHYQDPTKHHHGPTTQHQEHEEDPRGIPHAITISSFTTLSLRPPRLTFNLTLPSRAFTGLRASRRFNLHVLAPNRQGAELAQNFARPDANPRHGDAAAHARRDGRASTRDLGADILPVLQGRGVWAVLKCSIGSDGNDDNDDHAGGFDRTHGSGMCGGCAEEVDGSRYADLDCGSSGLLLRMGRHSAIVVGVVEEIVFPSASAHIALWSRSGGADDLGNEEKKSGEEAENGPPSDDNGGKSGINETCSSSLVYVNREYRSIGERVK